MTVTLRTRITCPTLGIIEQKSVLYGIISGTARCVNTKRSLTRLLDYTERGLAVKATQSCLAPLRQGRS